ncbi:MAG: 16S rRNA (guanine(527)-N(7))-methyltransferase RsmG [Trichlorobacter sp.]|nr:16S rRNA (guanine(527)-N(7))-methyltransferase RsmG [Trichlorobacter sp.]
MSGKLLQTGAASFGLQLSEKEIASFIVYLTELQRWNRSFNLTALKNSDEIIIKHFVDSLSLVPLLNKGEHLLDVGSGAGLPGLAVAILRKDVTVTTLDAVAKKIGFQRHICRKLGLCNVTAVHQRVEHHLKENPEFYSVVTSRAFKDLSRFSQLAGGLVKPGGRLIAMAADTVESDFTQWTTAGAFTVQESINYSLPEGMGSRKLIVLSKPIENNQLFRWSLQMA